MKDISTLDLRESLILLIPHRESDGEGGWREEWRRGPHVWACLWPLMNTQKEGPAYRVILRASVPLPPQIKFLWPLQRLTKRLVVRGKPLSIQFNRFVSMVAEEEDNA